jgi:putative membrane protein
MRVRSLVTVALVIATVAVEAHDGPHTQAAAAVISFWDAGALLLLAVAGMLYALGSWRLSRRGAYVRRAERVAFWSGWATLLAAVAPPLDAAAARTFSAHMVQHELLMLVGAPLMIAGRPIVPWLWALPPAIRSGVGAGLQVRSLVVSWQWFTTPVVAWALHGLLVWVWHAPALYELAVANEAVHALQHATFVGTAVLFWWGLVYGRYGRAAYGASALYVFSTMVHTGVLGAVFTLSETPFYGIYRDRAVSAGIDAVADQQLAGLYMWIPAGVIFMIFGLALVVAWMAEAERRAEPAVKATTRSA